MWRGTRPSGTACTRTYMCWGAALSTEYAGSTGVIFSQPLRKSDRACTDGRKGDSQPQLPPINPTNTTDTTPRHENLPAGRLPRISTTCFTGGLAGWLVFGLVCLFAHSVRFGAVSFSPDSGAPGELMTFCASSTSLSVVDACSRAKPSPTLAQAHDQAQAQAQPSWRGRAMGANTGCVAEPVMQQTRRSRHDGPQHSAE